MEQRAVFNKDKELMKIAFMSDVHANPKAFRAALDDAHDQKCDKIYLLGDVVGYGYDPNACIEMARKECDKVILGNHDAGLVGKLDINWFSDTARIGVLRHREQVVSKESLEWIRTLPYQVEDSENAFVAVHGTYCLPETFDYMIGFSQAKIELTELKRNSNLKLIFCGHTHDAFAYTAIDPNTYQSRGLRQYCDLKLSPVVGVSDRYAVLNIGSVGYPRILDASVYVIYDTSKKVVEFRMLPFDFKGYIDDLKSHRIHIPEWLEDRAASL